MAVREDILGNLQARLESEVDQVVTVKRSLMEPVEIKRYAAEELPALFILEPNPEQYDYQSSKHSYTSFYLALQLYFLHWETEAAGPTDLNALLDLVLIAVHSDIRNGEASVNTSVISVNRVMNNYPLQCWDIKLQIDYYHDYTTR